ncbi:unnamed protein product, partial [Closterium sp. NIES-54]
CVRAHGAARQEGNVLSHACHHVRQCRLPWIELGRLHLLCQLGTCCCQLKSHLPAHGWNPQGHHHAPHCCASPHPLWHLCLQLHGQRLL